jgi:hypothetical protein
VSTLNTFVGTGSWARKKAIINGTLNREQLFTDLMWKLNRKFGELAAQLDTDALASVGEHLDAVEDTLDMVRSENVAEESERDPVFRARVADEVEGLTEAMERILAAIGNV